jgi:DNA-binding transcriptional ArsR family regulator
LQQLLTIYRGLSHESRLRILVLLAERPLCVQHLQQILEMSQVEISKQLAYLKACDLVQVEKLRNWRVYSLPEKNSRELHLQLKCLQECARTNDTFLKDRERLKGLAPAVLPEPMPRSKPRTAPEPLVFNEPQGLEDHLL